VKRQRRRGSAPEEEEAQRGVLDATGTAWCGGGDAGEKRRPGGFTSVWLELLPGVDAEEDVRVLLAAAADGDEYSGADEHAA
jgi:hypothetical protein